MTDPTAPPDTPPPRRWTAGRIASLVYRVLWVLVLGGALAKWAERDFGIPQSIGSLPALALSWWLFDVIMVAWFEKLKRRGWFGGP